MNALVALAASVPTTMALVPILPMNPPEMVQFMSPGSSILVSRSEAKPLSSVAVDDVMLKSLEEETKAAEKLAKVDQRKANNERKREAFFEYEAKAAAEKEAQIEAAEQKALAEAKKDKEQAERIKVMEEKIEKEASLALSRKEKIAKQKEAKVCELEPQLLVYSSHLSRVHDPDCFFLTLFAAVKPFCRDL